jgi:hypothetical protein
MKEDSDLSDNEYFVEKVMDKKIIDGEVRYLIKWEGWPVESSTWEPLHNLKNIKNLIEEFERNRRENVESVKKKVKEIKPESNSTASPQKNKNFEKTQLEKNKLPRDKDNNSVKREAEIITHLGLNIPEDILSVKKDENYNILCLVRFKERPDGIIDQAYVPSSLLKELHPKVLIKFYESKIKFVEKK